MKKKVKKIKSILKIFLLKIVYLFFPYFKAKHAEKIINKKIDCLKSIKNCDNKEEKRKLNKEILQLGSDCIKKLKEKIEEEIERKEKIEDKFKSFLTIITLIGIIFSLGLRFIEHNFNINFFIINIVILFLCLLYIIQSINTIFYVLCKINIVYELPLNEENQINEIKETILLNRYQNIIRTNYLYTVFSNIVRFFYLIAILFIIYCIYIYIIN